MARTSFLEFPLIPRLQVLNVIISLTKSASEKDVRAPKRTGAIRSYDVN